MYKERDIVLELQDFWVLKTGKGWYEVYRTGLTHSTRVAVFALGDDKISRQRAIEECWRRQAALA